MSVNFEAADLKRREGQTIWFSPTCAECPERCLLVPTVPRHLAGMHDDKTESIDVDPVTEKACTSATNTTHVKCIGERNTRGQTRTLPFLSPVLHGHRKNDEEDVGELTEIKFDF